MKKAHWMDLTMFSLSAARSSNVLSSVILPSSDRIVVCASCTTAYIAFSTPYDALTGSTTCAPCLMQVSACAAPLQHAGMATGTHHGQVFKGCMSTLTKRTPSIIRLTLSLVMALCTHFPKAGTHFAQHKP